nr:uncharacterized protein LOC115268186 [Aedes albopictus]
MNFSHIVEEYADSSDDEIEFSRQLLAYSQLLTANGGSICAQQFGGSRPGKLPNINRFSDEGDVRLFKDYFAEVPVYNKKQFRRRFRMSKNLFLRIVKALERNQYFVQRPDATGKMGLSSIQKCTAALRQLAYGSPSDAIDEYVRMGESTARKCLVEFCKTVIHIFGDEYLRSPTNEDLLRLLRTGEERGFPGMLGSLDCTHWQWKNCPTAWAGQYKGKEKKPTIILEVVASYDLWIWHAFSGMPGSNNDINVLERSSIFSDLYNGKTPTINYSINNHTYSSGYYLADGIYPPLATLVQTIPSPIGQKRKHFAEMQESARKDVERVFSVLTGRFAIIKSPARLWNKETLESIMRTCIILHNMIIEDERDDSTAFDYGSLHASILGSTENTDGFSEFLARYEKVHDTTLHYQLQNDLVEHLWQIKGEDNY